MMKLWNMLWTTATCSIRLARASVVLCGNRPRLPEQAQRCGVGFGPMAATARTVGGTEEDEIYGILLGTF